MTAIYTLIVINYLQHRLVLQLQVLYDRSVSGGSSSGVVLFLPGMYHKALVIPYSVKSSRKKTCIYQRNFLHSCLKGQWTVYKAAQYEQAVHEVFSAKSYFPMKSRKFSPLKDFRYTVISYIVAIQAQCQ